MAREPLLDRTVRRAASNGTRPRGPRSRHHPPPVNAYACVAADRLRPRPNPVLDRKEPTPVDTPVATPAQRSAASRSPSRAIRTLSVSAIAVAVVAVMGAAGMADRVGRRQGERAARVIVHVGRRSTAEP